MITERFSYLELRKDELEILKKFFNYCQESDDEMIQKVNNQIRVWGPIKFFVEVTKNQEKKLKSGSALKLINLILRELESDIPISYAIRRFHNQPTGLLIFPTDLMNRINDLIVTKRLRLVSERTDRRKRIIYSYRT